MLDPDSTAYSVIKVIGFMLISMLVSTLHSRYRERKPKKGVEPDCSHLPPLNADLKLAFQSAPCWAVLGIEPTDDPREVKRAYRRLAHRYHPDKYDGDKVKEERLKEINRAYKEIMAGL